MTEGSGTLVSTQWLHDHLADPDLRILDASWYLPTSGRDGLSEYNTAHIPAARFFDVDEICDKRSDLPHMAPPAEKFMSRMRAMGIGDGHQVVIYDGTGILSAPRVWWIFRLMGHENVAVLDGGFPKWQAEGRPIEDMPPIIRDRHMSVRYQNQRICDVTQVSRASKLGDVQIIDARSAERFAGQVPEPRAGLRAGHIPGSINVPYTEVLNCDQTLKSPAEIRDVLAAAEVDPAQPIITTCGSGVTAAILGLAFERLGIDTWSLYDGSWAEWGMFETLPINTGPINTGST